LGSTRPALGLQIRQLLQGIAIAACVMGILYILEIAIIQSDFTANLKRPVIALLGRGSFLFLLGLALPAAYPGLLMLSYYLSEALALSLVLMYVLNRAFDFHQSARSIHKLFGIVLGFFAYSYLALFGSLNLFYILVTACAVVFIVESPFLKNEFLALLAFLQNLGTHIINAFRRLVRSLKILFQRFGWITWSSFSIITSFAVGWFTFPLFSDIVAMDPEGILYGIPSLSVPALIMGCLLLVVALARRRVRSSFGIFSVGIVVITSSITSTVWLFDRGFPEFAVLSFALILSMSVFALNLIRYNLNILKISSWISIPFCLSAILFYGIQYFVPVTHGNELGMLLSAILCTSLLLVSTHVRILPLILQKPIGVILAGLTAFTTFQISGLIGFSLLGCIYLAVFVFSWVLFPITRKEFLYLFLTPLFFSLTGFGYTFVFGDFIQSLFLAMAVALLFVSLDIREREKNLAELVYLRLAVLVALVSLLIAFGYSFFLTAFSSQSTTLPYLFQPT
jgi:hypothetical protein